MNKEKLKHTPGPWKIEDHTGIKHVYSEFGRWIADMPYLPNLQGKENDANAKLIAAAPLMLECLIDLYKQFKEDEEKIFTAHALKCLIEKATGQKIEEIIK
jgi:hypothetical protein